ncbi:MAG: DUF255 domain-containing protein [Methanosarcina sp.]|nr:DUF255 domain-containing protein [Methanosarcina sp.]
MARKSFEDEEIAGILNKYFVSIKVDREERPDLDMIYMNVCYLKEHSNNRSCCAPFQLCLTS